MKSKYMLLTSLLALGIGGVNAQYRGQVFIDSNGNGKQDIGENTIENVVVSDGYQVVKTNAAGHFELPDNPKARFVFATIPTGFKSSKTHFLKIDMQQKDYSIGLVKDPSQNPDELNFIQITDTETALYGSWVENVRKYAANQQSSLVMHTGDICYEPGMRFHAQQVNSQLMGVPVYYAVGNHDLVKGEYGEKLFEDLFGPTYYSFDAGPAHFVVTPMWGGDYQPSYTKDQVIAWLKKDLELKDKNKPVVFINHDFAIGPDFVLKGKTEEIDLKKYNLKAWLFGHWHNNYSFVNKENGVRVISTNAPNKGGIDHAVGQFLQIKLTKDGVTDVVPKYSNLNDHIQLIDPALQGSSKDKIPFRVQVYDSNREVKSVHVRVLDDKGQQLLLEPLKALSDWSWESQPILKLTNKSFTAFIEVEYNDGTQSIKKQNFGGSDKNHDLQLKWTGNLAGNSWKVSPLVVEGLVLGATFDDGGNGKSHITALDEKSGKTLWTFTTANSIKQKLRYENGIVAATDVAGNAYALEAKTGKLIWKKELSQGSLPSFVTAGVIYDGAYYTGYGSYLTALDLKTGQELWRNKDWNGGEAMPGEITVTEDMLFTGANWNSLFAHDRKSGKLLWKKNEDGLRFRSSGAAVIGQEVYVTGLNTVFVLDKLTGNVLRKKSFDYDFKVMATPVIRDNQLILSTSGHGVIALNKNTLEENWNFMTKEALIYTSSYSSPDQNKLVATVEAAVQYIGDDFIFAASDGYLYRLDKNGNLKEEINIGVPILAEVTVKDNLIYVTDFAGNVYCFKQ
ncbi:PQQ-binding-like beta-propeller repeat protein [Sphingobacterium sp. ML3W]|uniref:outer membrane protein assembly factor BamB family protein n=1 Tax=Sphingobacterium sp. ML3W TaxID=1538644 RepID=UPI0009DE9071|nr:PQQ-binding-like beta-propeller repeat protein [Sphingobacterium sp. ML3W]